MQTTTQIQGRPRLTQIEQRITDIELMLEAAGMGWDRLPATATEPAEEIGLSVGYDHKSGMIEIGTTHEVLTSFAVETPIAEIRAWIVEQSEKAMCF